MNKKAEAEKWKQDNLLQESQLKIEKNSPDKAELTQKALLYLSQAFDSRLQHQDQEVRQFQRVYVIEFRLRFMIRCNFLAFCYYKYNLPMDCERANRKEVKKQQKHFLTNEQNNNTQRYSYLPVNDKLEIRRKITSANSESTGETHPVNRIDQPTQVSSFKFLPHPENQQIKINNKDVPKPETQELLKPDQIFNSKTEYNYLTEKSSFKITILNGTNREEKMESNQFSRTRHQVPSKLQHHESTEISKSANPLLHQNEEPLKFPKKKKMGFSQVDVNFSSNQNSVEEKQIKEEILFDMKVIPKDPTSSIQSSFNFALPQAKASDIQSGFNFAIPSGLLNYGFPDSNVSSTQRNLLQKSERKELKGSSRSNQGENMFALQRILEASALYKNYLKRDSGMKKPSLNIPEVRLQSKIENLPREFFYKPERIVFHKPKDDMANDYFYHGHYMICKVNEERTRFYYQDLKLEQLYNMKGMKSSQIIFDKQLNISKNVEYDYFNKRLFIFSNAAQKLFVYSETSQEKLCEVSVQKKVIDPHLFIHHTNGRIFLLVIGGYCKIEKNIVQGSKFIQIFQLGRWEIQLKSRVINLITGRISPIILKTIERDQTKIFILGGNTIARINKKGQLDYDYEKDMNESTNLTGLSVSSHQILQLFNIKEQAICCNHSVKLSNPLYLHDGCVLSLKGSYLLLLPGSKNMFQVKVFNKEVNLIQGKKCHCLDQKEQYQQRQFCIRPAHDSIVFYTIDEQGLFQIIAPESEVQRTCVCSIY